MRQVGELLEETGRRRLAYTTTMTMLTRLHDRGLLERRRSGRQFLYRAVRDEAALMEHLSVRAVEELLARYGSAGVRQFAERVAELDPELRARLIELARTGGR